MVKGSALHWASRSLGVILDLFRCPLLVEEGSLDLSDCGPPLSISPPVFTCLKYSVLKLVELIFDFAYGLLSDPIATWRTIALSRVFFFQSQLSSVVWIFGLLCAFVLLNVLVFVGMRIASFYNLVRRIILVWFLLPIFVLLFQLVKWLWVGMAGTNEGKKSKHEERLASLSMAMQDASNTLVYGSASDGQFEAALRLDPKDPVDCTYCGQFDVARYFAF